MSELEPESTALEHAGGAGVTAEVLPLHCSPPEPRGEDRVGRLRALRPRLAHPVNVHISEVVLYCKKSKVEAKLHPFIQ